MSMGVKHITKDTDKQPGEEPCISKVWGFHVVFEYITPLVYSCVHQPESSPNPVV